MRRFSRLVFLLVVGALAPLTLGPRAFAEGAPGADPDLWGKFEVIESASPRAGARSPGEVEVSEVFSYGCIHCYRFSPIMDGWCARKPDYVTCRRVPVVFDDRYLPWAKAYYAAKSLGVLETVHRSLFRAIHDEGRRLDSRETLAVFFGEQGIDKGDFIAAYDSFAVDTEANRARAATLDHGIESTPTIAIQGKYLTSGAMAGSYREALRVTEILARKERAVWAEKSAARQ